jgi:hypothetical protein
MKLSNVRCPARPASAATIPMKHGNQPRHRGVKKVNRRGFLKGAAASGAVSAVSTISSAEAQQQVAQRNATAQPNAATLAADTSVRPIVSSRIVEKPGSDFMVDVLMLGPGRGKSAGRDARGFAATNR